MRIDTPKEQRYFRHGGILQFVLRQLLDTRLQPPASRTTSLRAMPLPNCCRSC